MSVKEPAFNSEGDVTQFRVVDELWIDPWLTQFANFWRINGLNSISTITSTNNVSLKLSELIEKLF